MTEPQVIEKRRIVSPAATPQALAWDRRNKQLWMGSRESGVESMRSIRRKGPS